MGLNIVPYTEDLIPELKDFNQRLRNTGVQPIFPESNICAWLPEINNRKIFQEYFLAIDENKKVRGGYCLKHQECSLNGNIMPVFGYRLPISEGIIDKKYNLVGINLLTNALEKQPLLSALGMGRFDEPLPKMLKVMGWPIFGVPFYFKINHPYPFLKNISVLRKKKSMQFLADFAAITGLGWIAIKLSNFFLIKNKFNNTAISYEIVNSFSSWVDDLWQDCKDKYALIAVRDLETLDILYPPEKKKFIRLKVYKNKKCVGWAVLLNTKMSGHKQFGNMQVGSIVDCLALPENADAVIHCAAQYLKKAGADIIVTNQSHISWNKALDKSGFMKGPTNFILAVSKELSRAIPSFESNKQYIHMNRGDGDGPINL